MRKPSLCLLVLLVCIAPACLSQDGIPPPMQDTAFYYYRICKQPEAFIIPRVITRAPRQSAVSTENKAKQEFLSVKGEMGYQRFSRSSPSHDLLLINSASDIVTFQAGVIVKETYPVTLRVRYNDARPFQLDNQYEVNLSFDERNFRQLLQEKIKKKLADEYGLQQRNLIAKYDTLFREYSNQKQYLQSPVFAQKAFEEKMKAAAAEQVPEIPNTDDLKRGIPSLPSSIADLAKSKELLKKNIPKIPGVDLPGDKADSLKGKGDSLLAKLGAIQAKADSFVNKYVQKKESFQEKLEQKRDSLAALVQKAEDSIAGIKKKFQLALDSVNNEMAKLKNPEELQQYAKKKHVLDSLERPGFPSLLMKTSVRFGKFIMNQSELTINNIFLSGASLKYGNEHFLMVTGGAYDFAFRGLFNFRNDTSRSRMTTVFAMKAGVEHGKNLTAFNIYTGKKVKDASLRSELRTVAGFSVEKRVELNRNVVLAMEIAKSTTRNNTAGSKDQEVLKDLFTSFNLKTIGAYGNAKLYFPKTRTDAELTYKYWGQQFESFNASQYFNPQNNFSAKLSQPFFKRRLFASAGLKYTDFSTTGIASNIHSKTLFASANMTMRLKKIPVISLGYYPGSQLYIVDQNKLYEYYYHILNATVNHQFTLARLPMQTVFSYNKFFNRYSDSLVSSAESSYNVYWTAWKGKFTWMANYSRQDMDTSLLNTVEAGLSYSVERFKIGGSLKWNRIDRSTEFGYAANLSWAIPRLGTIALLYDRSYLPDRSGAFIPVRMAQVQFIKPLNFKIWQ
jgi:hypothetical protein